MWHLIKQLENAGEKKENSPKSASKPFSKSKSVPASLYDQYRQIRDQGCKDAHIKPEDIYALLPAHLQSAYTLAIERKSAFLNHPKNIQIIDNLRDQIFGVLPKYDDEIKVQHAEGFMINGKLRQVFMDKAVATYAIHQALEGLSPTEVIKKATVELKSQFDEKQITAAVQTSFNYGGVDRQFIAKILQIANSMKNDLK